MKTQIDLSPEKNLARNSAFQHAQDRAARENKPMRVKRRISEIRSEPKEFWQ